MLQEVIHILGGMNVLEGVDVPTIENIYNVEVYDVGADTWFETAPMIPPITSFPATTLNESIYIVSNKGKWFLRYIIQTWKFGSCMLPGCSVSRSLFAVAGFRKKTS